MTDYTELVEALRHCYEDDDACATCQRWLARDEWGIKCKGRLISDAAAAIEALNNLVSLNTERCEGLREQLRKAQEQYDKHLNELEQQLPKRGQYVHGRELSREYIGDCLASIDYEDWRCSVCGIVFEQWSIPKYNYCPNCGAKMEAQE